MATTIFDKPLDHDVSEKLNTGNVYNGLDQESSGYALDARQGKALNEAIETLSNDISDLPTTLPTATTSAKGFMSAEDKTASELLRGRGAVTSDANNMRNSGWYFIGQAISNVPEGYGFLLVFSAALGSYICQFYIRPSKIYNRRWNGSAWEEWKSVSLS